MEWWQALVVVPIIGAIAGTVPTIIGWYLSRRGANKKLEIEEGGLEVSQFAAQTTAYQDLLDRANAAVTSAETEAKKYKDERESLLKRVSDLSDAIDDLKQADEEKHHELIKTNNKLERLRSLFMSYVRRTGIPLTPEEQNIFDATVPADIVRRIRRPPLGGI